MKSVVPSLRRVKAESSGNRHRCVPECLSFLLLCRSMLRRLSHLRDGVWSACGELQLRRSARAQGKSRKVVFGSDDSWVIAYLPGVEVTALMLSSPSASSPHAQSQSPPQPPGLQSPA